MPTSPWLRIVLVTTTHACVTAAPSEPLLGGEAAVGPSDREEPPVGASSSPDDSSGSGNAFHHPMDLGDGSARNPFAGLAKRNEDAPPLVRARLHGCQKLRVHALRNLLASFGVNVNASGDPSSAAGLLASGAETLGGARYDAREPEALRWVHSSATRFHDILLQAATEIVAALPTLERCKRQGKPVALLDGSGHCDADAITCLIGVPATVEQVAICNASVTNATTLEKGRAIAVASMMTAAHACE